MVGEVLAFAGLLGLCVKWILSSDAEVRQEETARHWAQESRQRLSSAEGAARDRIREQEAQQARQIRPEEEEQRKQREIALAAAERRRQEEAEQARQIRAEEEEQRKQREIALAAAAERRRQREEAAQQVLNDALEEYAEYVDFYIRSRDRFNCSNPRSYSCLVSEIQEDCGDSMDPILSRQWNTIGILRRFPERFRVNGDNRRVSLLTLTPYQDDDEPIFGRFKCYDKKCNCAWGSIYTYKDTTQFCPTCEVPVYPYEQYGLSEEEEAGIKTFTMELDLYMRTRPQFDSSDPTSISLSFNEISANCPIDKHENWPEDYDMHDFLIDADEFWLDGTQVSLRYLTPFQGGDNHRVFGLYKCCYRKCRRTWRSAYSYKNTWQKCQGCETEIYPYQQHVLEQREEGNSSNPPHDSGRCGRCLKGRPCATARRCALETYSDESCSDDGIARDDCDSTYYMY